MILIPAYRPDGTLEPVEKLEVHRRGQRHPAVSVFLLSGERMLLQRRAAGKYHCAGLWANACCTHPHWGESLSDAAHRRLGEELGVTLPLTPSGTLEYRADVGHGLVEHEEVQIFTATVDPARLVLRPDPEEVAGTLWIDRAALAARVAARPADFAPWLRIYLANHADLIFRKAA